MIDRNGEHIYSLSRHLYRMKPRTSLSLLIVLVIFVLGGSWLIYNRQDQEPTQMFPATIQRDCAPWDGSAFTVSIPLEQSAIRISIYRSPEIRLPITFSFPDETMREGNAMRYLPTGVSDLLTGTVWFRRVEGEKPVEGRFSLRSESGESLTGRFVAEWKNEIILCG